MYYTKLLQFLATAGLVSAQSFCSSAKHSGESVRITQNKVGEINGIGYELWADGGNNSATFYSDGSFSCSFSNSHDYLCRTGLSFDSTQTHSQIGHMKADFKLIKQNIQNVGYSYVGIYGWTRSPLVEYYIVDNWLSPGRPGDWVGNRKHGDFMIDGAMYTVYENTRYNAPSIDGNTTFKQFFSIRQQARDCGTIDITAHFQQWERLGMQLGKMHEAKVLGEAGNGNGGVSGTADFPYAKVYMVDSSGQPINQGGNQQTANNNNGGGNGGNGNNGWGFDFGGFNFGGQQQGGQQQGGQTTNGGGNSAGASSGSGNFFDADGGYFGPDCDQGTNYKGAYYTGDYTSPFKTILGKSDSDIQGKLDQLWNHYFKGDNNSKVFYDNGSDGYILDINNNDVRSEGMSYGMMISVQTGHKTEFDKLWNWAKKFMWHKGGGWDGYFAWKRGSNGYGGDDNCAPDGEMYFMMSLLFAAHRWNNSGYNDDAQYILNRMWNNSQHKLFNPSYNIITFQPQGNENNFSDPSYDLPAFVDLFSRWSTSNQDRWRAAAKATRDHLYKSSHPSSGLFSDYNNFDGTPHGVSYNGDATKYMYDAMRCAMNFGMDYYLFGVDAQRQTEMAKRIINHFERNGYRNARFNWDGSGGSDSYTLGETGANAVACYALMGDSSMASAVKKNLQMAWDGQLMTGRYRYYDGLVHYLSMIHLLGSFKIWKPKPSNIGTKTITSPYNGVNYQAGDTVYVFEDCKLYKATVQASQTQTQTQTQPNNGGNTQPNNGGYTQPNNGGYTQPNTQPNNGGYVVTNPNIGYGKSRCSARIVQQGYSCCSANCVTVYTDDDGNWGAENNQWCGCANAPSQGGFQQQCVGAQGYPCCQSTRLVYYTDTDGNWGVENDNWCIIR